MPDTDPLRPVAQERPDPALGSRTSLPFHYPVFVISSRHEMDRITRLKGNRFFALSVESVGSSFGVPWWLNVMGDHAGLSVLDCGASPIAARQALDCGVGWAICRVNAAQLRALDSYDRYRGRLLTLRPPSSRIHNLREHPHDSL
ncbi:hypothetical protein HKD28_09375 [Gluconobacter sp. LMG 1744]|uniref:hypothetical protein n=1 Tax=Gluconobacter TaxID=441 RepID=UPI001884DD6D|nr:hypothetical protein [Gluconobacter cadivus]MBF0891630.1 hypothetical protein [Gluconobacter cadivus]